MYTTSFLIMLGLLGMILHCLVELNKLNKANKGNYKMAIKEYFKLEIFSLLIAFFVVIGCSFISSEVQAALVKIGYEWLMGAAYVSIGYSAQSLLVFVMGKAAKQIDQEEEKK
jgi:heme/copper-type cytochrome/quinol oxidase subunit 2